MCRAEPCSAARPEARPRAGLLFWPTLGRSQERVGIEMGATRMLVAGGIVLAALATPAIALATTCPPPAPGSAASALHGGRIAPVAAELADAGDRKSVV